MTVSVSEPSPDSGTGRCSALMMPWVTVLRSPIYAHHDPAAPEPGEPYSFIDQGIQRFRYALLPHADSWAQAGTVPSLKTTVVLYWLGLLAASEMTWLLVTM